MEFLIAAFTLGFLGSFHCIGMCGPIALALPLSSSSKWARVLGALLYNLGRSFTYAVFGIVFGLLGKSFVIAGFQQSISIFLGVLILIIVLFPERSMNRFQFSSKLYNLINKLKSKFTHLFSQKNYYSLFLIGLLNGLLPCGLVYLGVIGAIATGDAIQGALFMVLFGLGTLPAMFSLALISNQISISFRTKIRKAVPFFVSAMAVLLILRGLNLGVPYVSPKLSKTDSTKHECCHKK
ncbi:MAG: sulfite exporter TauE/SafE family protein [Bacteroidetes bacterium]|nr:sulfite exporter TauE/SafE family protein [Bacteroidota bacterium]MBK9673028.1 sulfite exporter TauE/SafE family protein [Bacteroidota bacterium]MBK9801093.1 sulfite exporter TauE/SafE family protein [Bacteroidota bacterium]MBP6413189.1 sulfite exporter TauE/SafE family protein [Bacteroidia bacterium]